MLNEYDEKTRKYLTVQMFNSSEVTILGQHAASTRKPYHELPSPEAIAKEVKKNGCDTFEVTRVTEQIIRYSV